MGRTPGSTRRNRRPEAIDLKRGTDHSAYVGGHFNIHTGDKAVVWAPPEGELRKLRFKIDPDVRAQVRKTPELLNLLATREAIQWIERLEAQGYRLAARPEPLELRPSPDPTEVGWDWVIIKARFHHDGPVETMSREGFYEQQGQEHGTLVGDGGVNKYLEEQRAAGATGPLTMSAPEEAN